MQSNIYEQDEKLKSMQDSQLKKTRKLTVRKSRSESEKGEKVKDKKENKTPRRLKKSVTSDQEDWEGEDYTTRCVCDMAHNDEFMIECERCK